MVYTCLYRIPTNKMVMTGGWLHCFTHITHQNTPSPSGYILDDALATLSASDLHTRQGLGFAKVWQFHGANTKDKAMIKQWVTYDGMTLAGFPGFLRHGSSTGLWVFDALCCSIPEEHNQKQQVERMKHDEHRGS